MASAASSKKRLRRREGGFGIPAADANQFEAEGDARPELSGPGSSSSTSTSRNRRPTTNRRRLTLAEQNAR